jgi:hypothetical protein
MHTFSTPQCRCAVKILQFAYQSYLRAVYAQIYFYLKAGAPPFDQTLIDQLTFTDFPRTTGRTRCVIAHVNYGALGSLQTYPKSGVDGASVGVMIGERKFLHAVWRCPEELDAQKTNTLQFAIFRRNAQSFWIRMQMLLCF